LPILPSFPTRRSSDLAKPTDEILFVSPAGPIRGLDLFYGFRPALAMGMEHMAHHTGFTQHSLKTALEQAGFTGGTTARLTSYNRSEEHTSELQSRENL